MSPDRPGQTLRRRIPSAKVPSTRFNLTNKMMVPGQEGGGSENSPVASRALEGAPVTQEEADAILMQLTERDDNRQKTWSRMLVERYFLNYKWYFPRGETKEGPSLKKAWTYYEHVTLPRYKTGDDNADTVFSRAEPGEYVNETELYDWLRMKQSTLIEWGTGIDLYFISVRFFAALMFVCGLINLPAMLYYASDEYNGDSVQDYQPSLKASAVCNNTEWVACTDCTESDWQPDTSRMRFGTSEAGERTTLVLRNSCNGASAAIGYTNFATLAFVLVAVGLFSYYLRAREIRFDEDKVTTTDYSVVVQNPPPDAIDPEVWRDFFSKFATDGDQVTAITITLNNEVMVRKLLTRRVFMNQLRIKLPPDLNMDDKEAVIEAAKKYNEEKEAEPPSCVGRILDCIVVPICNIFNMLLPPDALVTKIEKLTEEIKVLQEKTYTATNVFITFEKESGQRTALEAMKVGLIDLFLNRTSAIAPDNVFDDRVLRVLEPTEPNAVRWLDLSYGLTSKIVRRGIALSLTVGMIAVAGVAVKYTRDALGVFYSGLLTTTFNSTIPQIIKILMSFEPHATEGAYQASLYLKITLFRWTLSAILAQIITPVTSTLGFESTDLLPTTRAILLSDVWLSPLLRLSDWMTNTYKHVFAPRAKTQEEMNLNFQGTFYNLGERYTDFTKVLFVVFFYSALFPAGFFFGAAILTFQYLVDKFSLVRIWGWTPLIGSELAVFSRRFFFSGAALAFCVVSSYAFAQFPYDNVCDPSNPESGFSGTYTNVTNYYGEEVKGVDDIVVNLDTGVQFCAQSFRDYNGFSFPPTPRIQTEGGSLLGETDEDDLTWMSEIQETITTIYGLFALAVTIAFFLTLFGRAIYIAVISFFMGAYEPEGDDQHIDFSSNPDIFAYVPQVKLIGQPFPYMVCDVDDIDQGLIGWNPPKKSYDYYNLIFDIPHKSIRRTAVIEDNTRGTRTIAENQEYLLRASPEKTTEGFEVSESANYARPIYSIIRHYPTKWQVALAEAELEAEAQGL